MTDSADKQYPTQWCTDQSLVLNWGVQKVLPPPYVRHQMQSRSFARQGLRVPYALHKAVDKKCIELRQEGVISPVRFSKWAAPLMCIPERDGSVHICEEYKVMLNQWLDVDQYLHPKMRYLFSMLAGGKHFTKLGLTQGFTLLEMDEKSKLFLAINMQKRASCLYSFSIWSR